MHRLQMSMHGRLADGLAGLLRQPLAQFLQRGIRLLPDQFPEHGPVPLVQGRSPSSAVGPGSQCPGLPSTLQQFTDERIADLQTLGGFPAGFQSFVTGRRHPLPNGVHCSIAHVTL